MVAFWPAKDITTEVTQFGACCTDLAEKGNSEFYYLALESMSNEKTSHCSDLHADLIIPPKLKPTFMNSNTVIYFLLDC
jgi:hypothetical protein